MYKETSQYRRDMLEWRRAQSEREEEWRRSRPVITSREGGQRPSSHVVCKN